MMEDTERDRLRDLAFFAEDTAFAGLNMRPLSILSDRAMELMGLTLLDSAVELSIEEESRQMALFVWLHTADLSEVCGALWDGTWSVFGVNYVADPVLIDEFRKWRSRLTLLLEACAIRIRPRPESSNDKTPHDLLHPSRIAFMIGLIASHTGFPRQQIKWQLFLPEAVQYYHQALRWNGVWTVAPGREIAEADLADRAPEWMERPGTVDTPPAS
jgi:hypothetical protein